MATSVNVISEENLRCVICSEIYKQPTTLQCNHTFCRPCLNRFVRNAVGVADARGVPCPVCRHFTPVSDPQRSVSEWVEEIGYNSYIVGLIESLNPEEKDCFACESNGKSTKATSWCDTCDSGLCDACLKVHNQMPLLRSHQVTKISSVPWAYLESGKHRICQNHNGERLTYFCEDCDVLACNTCFIINHRKCDSLLTLSEAGYKRRSELKKEHATLISKLEEDRQKLSQIKEIKANFCEREKTVKKSIKETANKIVADIREEETVLLQELTEISERELNRIEEDIKTLENITTLTLQNIELIKHLMTSGSDCAVISQQKQGVSGKNPTANAHDMTVRETDLKFSCNLPDIQEKLRNLILGEKFVQNESHLNTRYLGEIFVNEELELETKESEWILVDEQEELVTSYLGDIFINKQHHLETMFVIKADEDRYEPEVTDIILLTIKGIQTFVVTDWMNNCVKCFYTKHHKIFNSRVDVGGSLLNLSKLSRDMIAVSMTDQNKICLMRVTPDLTFHSTFNTNKVYLSLTAISQKKLAAGSNDPRSVDLIDLTGRILTSITTDMSDQELFYWPHYMCISPTGDIIISDLYKKAVTCLTQKGEVRFRYQPGESQLDCPRGLSCDPSGDVFVVDQNLHKVTKITRDGRFVKEVLTSHDGLKSPSSVRYHDNRLYIAQSGEIRVFKLH